MFNEVIIAYKALIIFFHWSLGDNKFPQISSTFLSIRTDRNNAVVWMGSICPIISKSSCFFARPLEIVSSTPITICITITFKF